MHQSSDGYQQSTMKYKSYIDQKQTIKDIYCSVTTYYSMNKAIILIFLFPLCSQIIAKMYIVEKEGENENRRKKTEMGEDFFLAPENDGKLFDCIQYCFSYLKH